MTASPLIVDSQVTPSVRVRRWRMTGRAPRWPGVAHEALEVACVMQGSVRYAVGRDDFVVGSGESCLVPVGHEHLTFIEPGTEAVSIWLGRDFVDGLAGLLERRGRRVLRAGVVRDRAPVRSLAELMLDEAERQADGCFLSIDALGEALAIRLLRQAEEDGAGRAGSDPRIRRAVDEVQARYAEGLSVDELARAAGMSRYHFSRQFRKQIGKSPYQYLVSTRVQRAAELLRRGRHSVTEAAYSVGFSDPSRFARAFRRQMGCAPSAYA